MTGIILLGLRVLAAIALYAFLGWALFLLWQSLRREALEIATRQVTPLDLLVASQADENTLLHFTSGEVVIGRDSDCECKLTHGTVSARHARLTFHHAQWWLDDLQSTNGTKLNGEKLQTPTVVVNGDTIQCGEENLTVFLKAGAQPATQEIQNE
jgi:pSer/pThr/pTyr-binding forkhead associated (FHA) protein